METRLVQIVCLLGILAGCPARIQYFSGWKYYNTSKCKFLYTVTFEWSVTHHHSAFESLVLSTSQFQTGTIDKVCVVKESIVFLSGLIIHYYAGSSERKRGRKWVVFDDGGRGDPKRAWASRKRTSHANYVTASLGTETLELPNQPYFVLLLCSRQRERQKNSQSGSHSISYPV